MNELILDKNAEELFLLLLIMRENPLNNSTEDLLKMYLSLELIKYLEDKINNVKSKFPKIEHFSENNSNGKVQQRIGQLYQRLLRVVNLYENTGN